MVDVSKYHLGVDLNEYFTRKKQIIIHLPQDWTQLWIASQTWCCCLCYIMLMKVSRCSGVCVCVLLMFVCECVCCVCVLHIFVCVCIHVLANLLYVTISLLLIINTKCCIIIKILSHKCFSWHNNCSCLFVCVLPVFVCVCVCICKWVYVTYHNCSITPNDALSWFLATNAFLWNNNANKKHHTSWLSFLQHLLYYQH